MSEKGALLIIDVQNDFCPGGALPIPAGDRVVPPLNRAAQLFSAAGLPVLASRDWHPLVTSHFRAYGGAWPVHCVAGSAGAAFHPDLSLPQGAVILSKGIDPALPGYSAFEGFDAQGRTLAELLDELGVARLYVGGLATDYCVLATVLDARQRGLAVTLLVDAVAGVEISAGDVAIALTKMEETGVEMANVALLTDRLQP